MSPIQTAMPSRVTKISSIKHWHATLLFVCAIVLMLLLTGSFNKQKKTVFVVQSDSMAPHYLAGARLSIIPQTRPIRWDVVVLRSPLDAKQLLLKRVVGLPGDSVRIQRGDIWINKTLLSKKFEQQKSTRILLAKESAEVDSAWEANQADWRRTNGNWHFQSLSTMAKDDLPARLVFKLPLNDDLPQNHAISRAVHGVTDVMIECRVTRKPGTILNFKIGGTEFILSATSAGLNQGQVLTILTANGTESSFALQNKETIDLICTTFDGEAKVIIQGELIGSLAVDSASSALNASTIVEIEANGGQATIEELSVWRDVYYEDFNQLDGDTWQLGPDEWFVLGDNPPVSQDSRNWAAPAGVPSRSIIGVVR